MRRHVLLYGLIGGILVALLRLVEYRYLVLEHSLEIYGGIVAVLFSALGIWLGLKLTRVRTVEVVREVPVAGPFVRDEAKLALLGITPRELEMLEALAAGHSTREIAERLFVSENTVKTHTARLFDKLQARRRTQAVQLASGSAVTAPDTSSSIVSDSVLPAEIHIDEHLLDSSRASVG